MRARNMPEEDFAAYVKQVELYLPGWSAKLAEGNTLLILEAEAVDLGYAKDLLWALIRIALVYGNDVLISHHGHEMVLGGPKAK